MREPIKIANFSGAVGDYEGALHDAVHGDPVDVLVGDYLAEITIGFAIQGFLQTPEQVVSQDFHFDLFLRQIEPELPTIAAKGLKVVANAGAFNPEGLAAKVRAAVAAAGLDLEVASVAGDNLQPRVQELAAKGQLASMDTGRPMGNLSGRIVAANAYLGAWGIVAALEVGADIVITGRVTDASLTVGPAAWWHGWSPADYDAIAGAIAAGHIIECGPQSSGGNFSGFQQLTPQLDEVIRFGFPIAEIAADGSSIITKQSRSGGIVTPDTVTAQLLYEIQGPRYLNPDAVLHVDSIDIAPAGEDRVRLSSVRGSVAPATTKVGCFYHDGWRLVMFLYVTGLDWREKVDWTRRQMQAIADSLDLDDYVFDPFGQPIESPANQAEATMAIRIAAAAQERSELDKIIAGFGSFGLSGIPGLTGEFSRAVTPRVEYWPGLVEQSECAHEVTLADGTRIAVPLPELAAEAATSGTPYTPPPHDAERFGPTRRAPLGEVLHTRSGDKGGDASLGVWCKSPEAAEWLTSYLSADRVHRLLGLAEGTRVDAFPLPNIAGQHYVLRGHFGRSGTGNIDFDQIGKGIGEHLRACVADIPERFLSGSAG